MGMFISNNHYKFWTFLILQFWNKFPEKQKPFSKILEYCILFQSTKIENTKFAWKTALSETNVNTNRNGITKLTYHKECSFASNQFIFLKISLSLKTSYKEFISCMNYQNVHINAFRKSESFISGCFFPVSILKPIHHEPFYVRWFYKGLRKGGGGCEITPPKFFAYSLLMPVFLFFTHFFRFFNFSKYSRLNLL